MSVPSTLRSLQRDLSAAVAETQVPGAVIAVCYDGRIYEAAAGVLSCVSQVSATPDSLFHIGSVSKLFTATQIMLLAEQGRIDIDLPYRHYVSEFTMRDSGLAQQVTIRHLLSHTSGIAGDFFEDTGPGDDCLEKYAKACSHLEFSFPPGERFSYCNTGYSLLGRLIEVVTNDAWEESLQRMLIEPIGMARWAVKPEQELRFRTSVGHRLDTDDGTLCPEKLGCRSLGPGGSRLALTPRELLRFAQSHLDAGVNGPLSAALARQMQEQQVALAFSPRIHGWGLGWMLFHWSGKNVIGHDGGTAGMLTQLRVLPDEGIAVALMSNGPSGGIVFRNVVGPLLAELADVDIPQTPSADPEIGLDLTNYVGTYRRYGMQFELQRECERIVATVSSRDGEDNFAAPIRVELQATSKDVFLAVLPGGAAPMELYFDGFDGKGRPAFLYALDRAHGRILDDQSQTGSVSMR